MMLRGRLPPRTPIARVGAGKHRFASSATVCTDGNGEEQHVVILGGGIAGLSTARYLLHLEASTRVTLIDRNADLLPPNAPSSASSYEQQICEQLHYSIPSRRNGNVICASLTVPWTSRPLWKEAVLPGLRSMLGSDESTIPSISFDWPSLLRDKNMWSFGAHFLLQKILLGRPEHQSNQSILEYHTKCLDDASDALIQSINYGRFAEGTKLADGSIKEQDSSGDIGLFCRGLLDGLSREYGGRFTAVPGEDVVKLDVKDRVLQGVTTMDQKGDMTTRDADMVVVALGVGSAQFCSDIKVPCPVCPAKGHLVTVSSAIDSKFNLTLDGGAGYAAPMAHVDPDGRRLYRLSGFVDFTPSVEVDYDRVEALMAAARVYLPDLELIDTSACHRPISADDRPLIGPSARYANLYLCTGLGSRGWSIGLGSGKLLASQMLGLRCEIDPEPFLPSRFRWSFR